MAARLTTKDLVSQVRSLIDEDNRESVDDIEDIIPALNRAQDYAANILARHYEAPLLKFSQFYLDPDQDTFDIPTDAFESRVEKLEIVINNYYTALKRIDYRDISQYETTASSGIPYYYCVIGNTVRVLGGKNKGPYRLWYLQDPAPIVEEQGRITVIPTTGTYVVVDEAGADLSVEQDSLNSFVNWVDKNSGYIKATLQIARIEDNRIYFKTVFSGPDRTTIAGRTISSSLPTDGTLDDYLCSAQGVCIPVFKKPFSNFLIQYAAAEISTLKLGGPAEAMANELTKLEKQVEHSWVGREQSLRVKKRNSNWALPGRRNFDGR